MRGLGFCRGPGSQREGLLKSVHLNNYKYALSCPCSGRGTFGLNADEQADWARQYDAHRPMGAHMRHGIRLPFSAARRSGGFPALINKTNVGVAEGPRWAGPWPGASVQIRPTGSGWQFGGAKRTPGIGPGRGLGGRITIWAEVEVERGRAGVPHRRRRRRPRE